MSSLYIHIPFCNSKCLYCDFYSVIYDAAVAADYVDVLCEQIERLDKQYSTIYIGGGTPTALGGVLLGKLLNSLKRFAGCATEFSLEANPESLSREILRLFLGSGVNRLSLGVQSFNDNKLNNLGRIHSAQAAQEAVHLARSAGFENIGIDLIFGVGNERLDGWRQELKKAAELPIRHISCYGLTYEKDTPLFNAVKKGALVPLEDEAAAEMYRYAIGYLEKEGFKQYEVSNFAQEGYACRHNQNYWENNAYLGLGASAVSYLDGVRKENVSDIRAYIARHKREEDLGVFQEKLPAIERAKETAALKIRTEKGIDFSWFKQKTGFDFPKLQKSALAGLTERGLISYNRGSSQRPGVHLTQKGFLFADIVSSELI